MTNAFTAAFLLALSTISAAAEPSGPLKVQWQHGTITYKRNDMHLLHGVTPIGIRNDNAYLSKHYQVVDCSFLDMRTKCWRIDSKTHVYGDNLVFIRPIAILPGASTSPNSITFPRGDTKADPADWSNRALNSAYVKKLKEFSLPLASEAELKDAIEVNSILGEDSEDHTHSALDSTIGGTYALGVWKKLLSRTPKRNDCDGIEEDYCSVVADATVHGYPAIVYCAVVNPKSGIGTPFSCNVVAFQKDGKWFVLSYNGPEQCDGCGAGEGASCWIDTDKSLNAVASAFIKVMKEEKTNIELDIVGKTKDGVKLEGRNNAKDSRFFAGYYDKSYARYDVSMQQDLGTKRRIVIDGIFNILISAEPSADSKNYRDIDDRKHDSGESELEWLNDAMLKIVKNKLSGKLGDRVDCQVISM